MNGTTRQPVSWPDFQTAEQPWVSGRSPAPAPTPVKKVRRWPWAVGGLVLGVVIGASAAGGHSAAPTTAAAASAPTTAVSAAPVAAVEAPTTLAPAPAAPVVAAVPAGPLTTFGNGTYEIGVDVAPGKYRSAGVADSAVPLCYFDQTDAKGTIKDQGVSNEGPSRATLRAGLTFKSSGCQQWVKVG